MTIVSSKELEGRPVLTIDSGLTPRSFAQSRLSGLLSGRGYIINPSLAVEEWIPEGTCCNDSGTRETMQIYGMAFPGKTLLEIIGGENKEEAWKQLYQCISVITRASIGGKITMEMLTMIAGAGPEAILLADDGRILILPCDLYTRCIDSHKEKVSQENRLVWIHPDYRTLNPSWSFAFLAGTLAYRIAAGFPSFMAEGSLQAEELALNMRNGIFEPLQFAVWPIRATAAKCINELISTGIATSTDTLLAFGPVYSGILDPAKEGLPETEEFLKTKTAEENKRLVSIRRKKFFRLYKNKFKIAAAVLVVFGVFAGTYIHDLQSKPSTKGLIPLEIVTGYYNGISGLDQEKPAAYTTKSVKIEYPDLITNLFVTSKVRSAYEPETGIMTPAQLFLEHSPGKKTVFGITALSIDKISESDTAAEYSVSFFIWMPLAAEKGETSEKATETAKPETVVQLSVYKYKDSVVLTYKKDRWKITGIQKIERTLVEGNGKALLESIAVGFADGLPYAPSQAEINKQKPQ